MYRNSCDVLNPAFAREAVEIVGKAPYSNRINERTVALEKVDESASTVTANEFKSELGLVEIEQDCNRTLCNRVKVRESEWAEACENLRSTISKYVQVLAGRSNLKRQGCRRRS